MFPPHAWRRFFVVEWETIFSCFEWKLGVYDGVFCFESLCNCSLPKLGGPTKTLTSLRPLGLLYEYVFDFISYITLILERKVLFNWRLVTLKSFFIVLLSCTVLRMYTDKKHFFTSHIVHFIVFLMTINWINFGSPTVLSGCVLMEIQTFCHY